MKNIIYLVQGTADLVAKYYYLKQRNDIEVLFLTYDVKIDGAYFLPNSTWGEGRNYLLEISLELNEKFLYYIFLDDDITFLRGSFEDFEKLLLKHKPAVGVPVFIPKTQNTILSKRLFDDKPCKYQICRHADAQFLALHIDIINQRLVVPLQTQFDSISWWCTSSTQQLLLFNLYPKHFLQFNYIEISNDCHRHYTNNDFKDIQKDWFSKQFRGPISDFRQKSYNLLDKKNLNYVRNNLSRHDLLCTIKVFINTLWLTFIYRPKRTYYLKKQKLNKKLFSNSILLNQ